MPAMPVRTPIAALLLAGLGVLACNEKAIDKTPAADSGAAPAPSGLSPELAQKPLATVGDRVITLGEFAATIDRMDQFERLRYQSVERRRQLLDEMIKAELLAIEAKKRGLDQKPEVKERVRQILREDVMRQVRTETTAPADIPEAEVRAYYDKHRDEFRDPERRRVAHVVVADEAKAKQLLEQAKKASPTDWGKLVRDHSLDKPPQGAATGPAELAGDLGIVGPPGAAKGDNPRVPEPLREAVFKIAAVGGIHEQVVAEGGKFHIVRMTGKTDARDRTLAEAERTIRVAILQERVRAAEAKLEQELRARYPVKIDDKALEKVEVPRSPLEKLDAGPAAPK
ncbi:MAG: peptidyl-prolyl cis-trans isomerase [Sorangiineae bacterium PRO1]|nr:peptidyl-prolyl cis-trans isomerase [Sorangiineae bacterium PRO1]